MDLSQQRAFVTGGTSGIGRELAKLLSEKGAEVAVCGQSRERLDALALERPAIRIFRADLGRIDELPSLVRQLLQEFGAPSVLVNNAGIQFNEGWRQLGEADRVRAVEREIAVNLTSPLALTALLMDSLVQHPDSVVVNVTSVLAWKPKRSAPVYCATKAALRSFTEGMRYQLAEATGIRMVEVVPPLVETAMTAGRGVGKISAREAAVQIVRGLERDLDHIYVGKAKILASLYRLSPGLVARILRSG